MFWNASENSKAHYLTARKIEISSQPSGKRDVRAKIVACNNGAGGYTKRNVNTQTRLTEPQGKIKK